MKITLNKKTFVMLLFAAAVWTVTGVAHAQALYPTRTVSIVVPYAPGGVADIYARSLANKLTEAWGKQVIVENKTGAATNIAAEYVARAKPDGHTLFVGSTANSVNMSLFRKLSYDLVKNFAPVTLLNANANVLLVHPSIPANSLPELIAFAKANPGKLSYSSTGNASSAHLSGELFKEMSGVDILHVPYKGGSEALIAVLTGEVSMSLQTISTALGQLSSGKIRALAVTCEKRSPVLPAIPAISEFVPGYSMVAWQGLLAPAGTPPEIVVKLHDDVTRIIRSPDFRTPLEKRGVEILDNSPSEFAAFIKADIEKFAKLVKQLGLKVD